MRVGYFGANRARDAGNRNARGSLLEGFEAGIFHDLLILNEGLRKSVSSSAGEDTMGKCERSERVMGSREIRRKDQRWRYEGCRVEEGLSARSEIEEEKAQADFNF